MRRLASPPRPRWGPDGPKSRPNGRHRPPAPAPYPTVNDRAAAPKHTRPRDPSRRARPPPADTHHRREEDALESPPSARVKAVHRHRRHQGFARWLLPAAATGEGEGFWSGERQRRPLTSGRVRGARGVRVHNDQRSKSLSSVSL
jgi:hypothetical protein